MENEKPFTENQSLELIHAMIRKAQGKVQDNGFYFLLLGWLVFVSALGMYARTSVIYRPLDRDRTMPLLLSFVLIGFFIWLAENISTFFGIWRYPDQLGAWTAVHVGKWSSWSLLVVMTFTIVANLKHIRERIHVPA